ncbi:MAG TPA: S4 domain-containing protein [Bacteroidales bacterium]|nr:S4 domain-containing protein [Bacteroidales bacterium]
METRIDKFLWAVRVFKSRSAASEACKKGKIIIGETAVKPSRNITAGEKIIVKKPPVTYTYIVVQPIENRVGAKLVSEFVTDITPEEEKVKINPGANAVNGFRPRGAGRPTKRERRDIEDFFNMG